MHQDADGIDQQFRPHPCADSLHSTDPRRQRRQATTKGSRVAEGTFNLPSRVVEFFSELVLQQLNAAQPMRGWVMFPAAGLRSLAVRSQQLIALLVRPIIQVTGVVFTV